MRPAIVSRAGAIGARPWFGSPRRRLLAAAVVVLMTGACAEDPGGGAPGVVQAELLGPPSVHDQCKLIGTCIGSLCLTLGNKADGTACDDGNGCTRADRCVAGTCTAGAPVVCEAPDCHTAGVCDPATGACSTPIALADGTACGDDCGACSDGACEAVRLAASPPGVTASGLAVADEHVYWGDGAFDPDPPHWIRRAPKAGGPVTELVAAPAQSVAIDDDSIYFVNGNAGIVGVGAAPLAGGEPSLVAQQGLQGPWEVTAAGGRVYFTDFFAGRVLSVPRAGGPLEVHADGQFGPDVVVATDSHVVWTTEDAVRARALAGGPVVELARVAGPRGLAVDATHAYYTSGWDGTVERVRLTGGLPEVLVTSQPFPGDLTVDGEHVYWVNHGLDGDGTTIGRVHKTGSNPEIIASGGTSNDLQDAIVVDDACVYWTAEAIYRAPR